MIKGLGINDVATIGWYSMGPYMSGAAGLLLWPWLSDRFNERRWFLAIALTLTAFFICLSASMDRLAPALAAICGAMFFAYGAGGVFWTVPPTYFSGPALGPGIAMISSLGTISGMASPTIIGVAKTYTGTMVAGLYAMSGMLIIGSVLALFVIRVGPANRPQGGGDRSRSGSIY